MREWMNYAMDQPMTQSVPYPQWTSLLTRTEVTGEDHLGIEGVSQAYQQYLVPGIITTTEHARYYSFYCWVLDRFIHAPGSTRLLGDFQGSYFKRHEVAFLLGCYTHHQAGGGLPGTVGNKNALRILASGDLISLDQDYFTNKLGGFGQYYRTAMEAMGLLRMPQNAKWVYKLTHQGKALADAYAASIAASNYSQALQQGVLTFLSQEDARQYGEVACLCATALGQGADRPLLIEAFFRFDVSEADHPHIRRRLTLALVLDLVRQSDRTLSTQNDLRRALFLGEFSSGIRYTPPIYLSAWYQRWRYVQARQTFTTALQALWAHFLIQVRNAAEQGITFSEFIDWAFDQLPAEIRAMTVAELFNALCEVVGLPEPWFEATIRFDAACNAATQIDEVSLYQELYHDRSDPTQVISLSIKILGQFFLRFLPLHQQQDPLWLESANRERLPMSKFMADLLTGLSHPGWSIRDFIELLYRDYIIGQHEIVALGKLRYQNYNTFKYYYQEGSFIWGYNPTNYQEPIRYPALRLFNCISILTDLGLLENVNGAYQVTPEGNDLLSRLDGGAQA